MHIVYFMSVQSYKLFILWLTFKSCN